MVSDYTVDFVVQVLATLVLLGGLFIAAVLLTRLYRKKDLLQPLWKHALPLAFFVALTATLGSLFLSEIAGWSPCKLCWLQRICMYPLTVMLGMAWWKKLRDVRWYAMPLAVIGAVIASYHYYIQRFASLGIIPCDPVGGPCNIVYTFTYGYITIPMMALTGFLLILVLLWKDRKS